MSDDNDTDDKFTLVKRKNSKSKCIINTTNNNKKLTLEDIKNNIKFNNLLNEYSPLSVILYGSLATGKNRITSDIDLMFIWQKKSIPSLDVLENIKKSIEEIFERKVDLVNMVYMNKQITFIDEIEKEEEYLSKDYYYIVNVYNEGVIIYGNDDKNVILFSEKSVKLV